jgi:flagellar motor switch protein FliG
MKSFFKRFKWIAGFAALLALTAASLQAAKEIKGGIESKIALEASLENRLKKVLTEITGTDQIIVIVNVQLASEQKEEKPKKEEADFILPGVPIKEAISEKQVADSISAAIGEDTRTLIKKLTATVIIDRGVSASVENVVKEVAMGILAIDATRGDQLIIQKMSFNRNPFYWGMLLYPPNIYWVFMVIAAVILSLGLMMFLFGPFKGFTTQFAAGIAAAAAALKEGNKSEGEEAFFSGGGSSSAESAALQSLRAQKGSFGGREAPFSFVNPDNISSLIFLIKNESADTIGSILNYLSPELSVQVLKDLPSDKQSAVGIFLAKVRELDPSEMDRLEAKIKNRIGFLSGGKDKISQLLDYTDERFKDKFLASLKMADSQLAGEVQKSLVNIEILSEVDVSTLQSIIRTLTPSVFAQILKNMDVNIREKVLAILPQGAAARLKQEIDMTKPFAQARYEMEKRRLINLIRTMEERGLLIKGA